MAVNVLIFKFSEHFVFQLTYKKKAHLLSVTLPYGRIKQTEMLSLDVIRASLIN